VHVESSLENTGDIPPSASMKWLTAANGTSQSLNWMT
jgi:hypothetical protein